MPSDRKSLPASVPVHEPARQQSAIDHGIHLAADDVIEYERRGFLTAVHHGTQEIPAADACFLYIRQIIKTYLHICSISFLAQKALEHIELIFKQFKTFLMRTVFAGAIPICRH